MRRMNYVEGGAHLKGSVCAAVWRYGHAASCCVGKTGSEMKLNGCDKFDMWLRLSLWENL